MDNFDLMIEKYKNEMMKYADKATKQINDQSQMEMNEDAEEQKNKMKNEKKTETEKIYKAVDEKVETVTEPVSQNLSGRGKLKINVFTGNEAFPVMSAFVKVLKDGELLFSEFTDQSGSVQEIYLPAPSRKISENPGNGKGYAEYWVEVSHPRFNSVVLENVPVFDGVRSIQPVALEPVNNEGVEIINETEPEFLEEGNNGRFV